MVKMGLVVVALMTLEAQDAWAGCGAGAGGGMGAPAVSMAPPPMTEPGQAVVTTPAAVEDTGAAVVTYHDEVQKHAPLVSGGVSLLSLAYVGGAIDGIATKNGLLAIPLAGPFVGAAEASSRGAVALLAIDGALQLGGLAMVIAGALTHHHVRVAEAHVIQHALLLPAAPLVAQE